MFQYFFCNKRGKGKIATESGNVIPEKKTMKNILTFDIEEWFHANYCGSPEANQCKDSNFRENMEKLLTLCKKNQCKATFFVLGCIGENYPDIVRKIAEEGHDVASHGYGHELAYKQSIQEFEEDVKKSLGILEDITGKKVLGYRAPSWSIVESNLHYLEVLEKLGIRYDASIFPVKTFLYGIPDAKKHIHRPVVKGRELNLYEVPTSVFNFLGRGVGYSGGFYFRFFPKFFIKRQIRKSNGNSAPSILYLHPREIDANEKRLVLPPKERFIHYYNIQTTFDKLNNITSEYEFTSIRDYLKEGHAVDFSDGEWYNRGMTDVSY